MLWFVAGLGCNESPRDPQVAPPPPTVTEPSSPAPETTVPTPTQTGPQGPNVLVVLLDDLGASWVDPDSDFGPPTPNLDALAAEGVTFRNAWGAPLCSPARAEILTGRYPNRTGVGTVMEWLTFADIHTLAREEVTIPEMLAGAPDAWSSAWIGKWHVDDLADPQSVYAPLEQGFDEFRGTLAGTLFGYRNWAYVVDGVTVPEQTYATRRQSDDAIEMIRTLPSPWFVTLAFNAPHAPYEDPHPAVGRPLHPVEAYRRMIVNADAEMGRVLDAMTPEQRAATTVIFLADNGQPNDLLLDNSEFVKFTTFEGGVHVPMVVAGPLVAQPGSVTDALVDVTDLYPTIAELAGVDVSDDPIDGHSFLPVLADPEARVRDTIYAETWLYADTTYTWAVRDERYKLIRNESWYYGSYQWMTGEFLFDLQQDPGETTDLAGDPALADELEALRTAAAAYGSQGN